METFRITPLGKSYKESLEYSDESWILQDITDGYNTLEDILSVERACRRSLEPLPSVDEDKIQRILSRLYEAGYIELI